MRRRGGRAIIPDAGPEPLHRLLRCELTVVHQQFIHILALRAWGETETAARINAVDQVDFPNAMRIIDLLVDRGLPLGLAGDSFAPGAERRSVLLAEQSMERRIAAVLADCRPADPRAAALVAAAEAPRAAYVAWLAGAIEQAPPSVPAPPQGAAEAEAFAWLLALIEQTMVHAFVQWHRGSPSEADWAWASSGAAMMQATDLVQFHAGRRNVPVPAATPAPRTTDDPAEAMRLDCVFAGACAERAALAAREASDGWLGDFWQRVAAHGRALAAREAGSAHPAVASNPKGFHSFERTLRTKVRTREPVTYG